MQPASSATRVATTPSSEPAGVVEDAFNPSCVRQAGAEDSLERIAARTGGITDVGALWAENGFLETVPSGAVVDVCVGNAVDDISGGPRPPLEDPTVVAAFRANVERQQVKLNELFAPFGTRPLAVDGESGPRTGQRWCAARLAFGLTPSIATMPPGSDEQAMLFAADHLPTPASSATASERWALIDRTCQMIFIGAGPDLTFVFPVSTGSAGFETRDQDRAVVFRYNPATENGGWHNSSDYPVGVDNPLNGNLYKPLYFDFGQAIHGANNVPPTPASKGCVRLSVDDQTTVLTWLLLVEVAEETWMRDQINLTVNVQGAFLSRY